MELNTEDVFCFKHRRVPNVVLACRRRRIVQRCVVAMREIKIRLRRQVLQELRIITRLNLVPTHVRHARGGRESANLTRKQSQAPFPRRFFTRFEQSLQPQADAQKRNTRSDAFQQRISRLHSIQSPHHLSKVPHAGKNDLRRTAQPFGVPNQFVFGSNLRQSVLHRAKIARPVIENRDQSNPFVDGSCSFNRASLEQAKRSARAKHLNIASIL
jgi:hypothetical protein